MINKLGYLKKYLSFSTFKFTKKTDFFTTNLFYKHKLLTIFGFQFINKMNKNTVLALATFIMIFVGIALIALGAFRYNEIAGWGFAAVGIGFFAIAWVFNALKGRV